MSGQSKDTSDLFVVTSVRLPRDQHDRLRALAESSHRTVSGQMRLVVARYLDDLDALDKAA